MQASLLKGAVGIVGAVGPGSLAVLFRAVPHHHACLYAPNRSLSVKLPVTLRLFIAPRHP